MTTGQRIKQARKWAGMTQEDLGKKLGVSGSSIAQYETNNRNPKFETLQRIADALGISVAYLLSGDNMISNTTTHLTNGVHIYRNTFPFKVVEPFLDDPPSNSYDVLYQDEYLIVAVDKESSATDEELEKILDAYAPYRKKDAEFMVHIKEGEFHTRINTAFHALNFSGKQEAVKRVEELTEIPRYRAETTPQLPPEPKEGKDATPPPDAPEMPSEGE